MPWRKLADSLQERAARAFDSLAGHPRLSAPSSEAISGPISSGTPARPIAITEATKPLFSGLPRTRPPPKSVSIAAACADAANVAHAAYEVGYGSPSQFSREHARMCGAPPKPDITELKTAQL
jgi:AraC-like DNA-binding protein